MPCLESYKGASNRESPLEADNATLSFYESEAEAERREPGARHGGRGVSDATRR